MREKCKRVRERELLLQLHVMESAIIGSVRISVEQLKTKTQISVCVVIR